MSGTPYRADGAGRGLPHASSDHASPQGLTASSAHIQNRCMSWITAPWRWLSENTSPALIVKTSIDAREAQPRIAVAADENATIWSARTAATESGIAAT